MLVSSLGENKKKNLRILIKKRRDKITQFSFRSLNETIVIYSLVTVGIAFCLVEETEDFKVRTVQLKWQNLLAARQWRRLKRKFILEP